MANLVNNFQFAPTINFQNCPNLGAQLLEALAQNNLTADYLTEALHLLLIQIQTKAYRRDELANALHAIIEHPKSKDINPNDDDDESIADLMRSCLLNEIYNAKHCSSMDERFNNISEKIVLNLLNNKVSDLMDSKGLVPALIKAASYLQHDIVKAILNHDNIEAITPDDFHKALKAAQDSIWPNDLGKKDVVQLLMDFGSANNHMPDAESKFFRH